MKNKAFAIIASLVLVLAVTLPATVALSTGADSKQSAAGITAPAAQAASVGTAGESAPAEGDVQAAAADECTCPVKPAEGEAHQEGCPLYTEPEKALYDRLMAAETADDFMAIIGQTSEEELNALSDSQLDDLDDYYAFLTTGEYPDHTPVVDEVMEIVNYTDVAPFGEPVTGGQN